MSSTGVWRSIALSVELLAICGIARGEACPPPPSGTQAKGQRLRELDQAGARAMGERRYSDAIAAYREQSCLAPDSSGVFYSLGVAQAASGDYLDARKSFLTADGLEPSNHLPLAMIARTDLSLGDIDGLKATLRDAAARFPRDAEFHGTLARFLAGNKQLDLALAESLRARRAGGTDPGSELELAVLENTAGAYDDAIRLAASLDRLSVANAMRASAEGVAGLSYEGSGQRDAAISHLREAIRLNPSQENSYLALAFILEKSGRFREAAGVLEAGHRALPDSAAIHLSLGSDLVGSGQYVDGIKTLKLVLARSPDEPKAYLELAQAYRETGNPANELKTLQYLELRKPDYPQIHLLIARAMLNLQPPEYAQALDELTAAERGGAEDPDVLYTRGKILAATGRDAEAVETLRKSIELRPMDPGPYYQLGRLYQKLGKADLARETLARMQYLKGASGK